MPNIVEFVSFNLKKGVSVPDFLLVSEKMNHEFLAARKGYISRKLLVDGDVWADLGLWETMEDAQSAANAFGENDAGCEYMTLLDEESVVFHDFSIEKSC